MGALVHLAHTSHALEENRGKTEFICNGCNQKGDSGRYECVGCGFYLHYRCAKAPKILKRCSKHDIDDHHMELNYFVDDDGSTNNSDHLTCTTCRAQIASGLFYRCKVCSFTIHMVCAAASTASNGPSGNQPQKPQLQNQRPQPTRPRPSGRKRRIAARIATGVLVGVTVVAVKGAITMATVGSLCPFDGSELGYFVPDCSDLGGGEDYQECDVPQEYGTDGCAYGGTGGNEEFEFDFGFGEEREGSCDDGEFIW